MRRARGRHNGRSRRRYSQRTGISDHRKPCRACKIIGAHPVAHSGKGANLSFLIRPARPDDLQPLYEMAKLAGDGFTNLPADRDALAATLERNEKAMRSEDKTSEIQPLMHN